MQVSPWIAAFAMGLALGAPSNVSCADGSATCSDMSTRGSILLQTERSGHMVQASTMISPDLTCQDVWSNMACKGQFGSDECSTCGERIELLIGQAKCLAKGTHINMNSWYGNRAAKESDCDYMCKNEKHFPCKRSQFFTSSQGTCLLYDCISGDTEAEAKSAVATEFPAQCGACGPKDDDDLVDDGPYHVVWRDEFNVEGDVDQSKWSAVHKGGGHWNNELQFYSNRSKNAWVSDGTLKIKALRENYGGELYTSAKLESKADWKYGRFHVRARLNKGTSRGTWPAHWMMPRGSVYGSWPRSGEIDIMEHVGYQTGKIHGTVHTEDFNHRIGTQIGGITTVNMDAWHTYTVDWRPDLVAFSVDGAAPYNTFKKQGNDSKKWPFDHSFFLILNMAVGGSWGGVEGVDEQSFRGEGQIMEIDWVRVEQRAVAPTPAPTLAPTSAPTPASTPAPVSSGCCKWGANCAGCGGNGLGKCHASASACSKCTGLWDPSGAAPTCTTPAKAPAPPVSGGCCKWGEHCAGCDPKVGGQCHASASACSKCTGLWDPSGAAPTCTTMAPAPAPPVSGGCCKWGEHCAGCDPKVGGKCHASASDCVGCTGQWDPSGTAPTCR